MTADFDPAATAQPFNDETDEVFELELEEEKLMPPGVYPAKLTDMRKDVSSSGNDMFVWEFTIGEGEYTGTILLSFTALTPSARWKLRETLHALKVEMDDNKLSFRKNDVVGRWVMAVVDHTVYQGQKRAQIQRLELWPDGQDAPQGTPF